MNDRPNERTQLPEALGRLPDLAAGAGRGPGLAATTAGSLDGGRLLVSLPRGPDPSARVR